MKSSVAGVMLFLAFSTIAIPSVAADDSSTGGTSMATTPGEAETPPVEDDSNPPPSPFGGTDTGQEVPAETVTRTATQSGARIDPDDGVTPANPKIISGDAVSEEDAVVDTSDGPTCALYQPGETSADGTFSYSGFCLKRRVCGSERVDDVVSGRVAGSESAGRYRDYLDLVGEFIVSLNDTYGDPSAPVTPGELQTQVNSVSDVLLERGLKEPPTTSLLPVFYWCANYDINGTFDPVDTWEINFGWDLTVDDVYNIDAVRAALYAEVTAELDLYKPEIGLVPHTELGYTFVAVPTWMFLQNPADQVHRYATNNPEPVDTLRVDLRATVIDVQWSFAGETIAICASADMKIFDRENHSQIDDLPKCHYRFPDLGYSTLTATVRYKIQEQVRTRQSSTLHDYPAQAWSDYLGVETIIELTSTIPRYEVHGIYSLNIAPGVTAEEALARAKANGQIPPLPSLDKE